MNIDQIRSACGAALVEHRHQKRLAAEEDGRFIRLLADLGHARSAQEVLQAVAQATQTKAHVQISQVVTRCLKAVWGEDAYTFSIKFDRKRGKTDARMVFLRDGREVSPTGGAGGGVVDVAAFGLRLAALLLSTPRRRRLLLLDEPFRMIDRDHAPRVGEPLKMISEELGVQIVMVTHNADFECGKVVRL